MRVENSIAITEEENELTKFVLDFMVQFHSQIKLNFDLKNYCKGQGSRLTSRTS